MKLQLPFLRAIVSPRLPRLGLVKAYLVRWFQ